MKTLCRAIVAAVLAAAFLFAPVVTSAQGVPFPPPLTYSTFSLAAPGQTPWLPLNGYSTCTTTFTSVGSGASVTFQGASDSPNAGIQTAQTITSIAVNGVQAPPVINTSYGGAVAPSGLTYFRLNLTALASGTVAGSITCSNATASGGAVTATISGTASVNNAQIAGSAVTTAVGLSGQRIYPANTAGGGCAGINLSTGTQIVKVALAPVTITASEASTQIIALSAAKFIHICAIDVSGTLTTAGAINVITGTGVNCAGAPATIWTYQAPASGFVVSEGNGEMGWKDGITAGAICVSSGAFVATFGPTMNITYALY